MPPSPPPAHAGPAARFLHRVRDHPVTVSVATITAIVGAAQFAVPEIVSALQRDGDLVRAGQWWRLLTALLVQPSGWGQYAYNLLGIVLIGLAVERRCGPARWLTLYVVAGVAGAALTLLLFPHDVGGGSSDAVAGLIGGLTVLAWRTRRPPPWWSAGYAVHFAAYLTVLATAGAVPATVAGALAVAVTTAALRSGRAGVTSGVLVATVLTAAVIMTALRDGHGFGLLTGLLLALLLRPCHPPRQE